MRKEDPIVRFWRKVDVKGPDDCWDWTAATNGDGYGQFRPISTKPMVGAHRFSFEILHGPQDSSTSVRHTCDRPPCVNPAHLIPGTHGDNVRDCISRGRGNRAQGSQNGWAKLTESDIRMLAQMRAAGATQAEVGQALGVSQTAISRIERGQGWRHVVCSH